MKSEVQKRGAIQKIVDNLLILRWQRVEDTTKLLVVGELGYLGDTKKTRRFQFFKADGTVCSVVEFYWYEFFEGDLLGSIFSLHGKIYDAEGNIVLSWDELGDARGKLLDHPMCDLYKAIWDKDFGEPVMVDGKFKEADALEKFAESLIP